MLIWVHMYYLCLVLISVKVPDPDFSVSLDHVDIDFLRIFFDKMLFRLLMIELLGIILKD